MNDREQKQLIELGQDRSEVQGARGSAPVEDAPHAHRGPLLNMHRMMGNAAVQMMSRAPVLRKGRESTPDWMEQDLGVTSQDKSNFQKMENATASDPGSFSRSGAQPLPAEAKSAAESHHGYNMDGVRVIQGSQADKYCDNMNAQAFCTPGSSGSDIFMHSSVDLSSRPGQHTLQHEIAHAVQNSNGETSSLSGLGGDPGTRNQLEKSADVQADNVMAKHF